MKSLARSVPEAWARSIARDARLKREVALKILPASFASDPDRLARFQRDNREPRRWKRAGAVVHRKHRRRCQQLLHMRSPWAPPRW